MSKKREIRPVTDTVSAAKRHYGCSDEELSEALERLRRTNLRQYRAALTPVLAVLQRMRRMAKGLLGR